MGENRRHSWTSSLARHDADNPWKPIESKENCGGHRPALSPGQETGLYQMLLHRPALNSLGKSAYFAYQARPLHIRKRQKICYSAGYPVLHGKEGWLIAFSELELLARIVECEAGGEGENGMKAVGCVVMNRVEITYGEYGRLHTIRDVVFQTGQFTCARTVDRGAYNAQNLYNMRPTQVHYDIANWAIAGNRLTNLGFALWFFNPFTEQCRPQFTSEVGQFVMRIGDHCFYNPTENYAQT